MTQRFDLVLRGGHVADPANGTDGVRDVGFRLGKVERFFLAVGAVPRLAARVQAARLGRQGR